MIAYKNYAWLCAAAAAFVLLAVPISATASPTTGAIVGRVVRRFVGGFALKFAEPQSRDSVETMATVNDQK